MENLRKNSVGITLVALVVTIVILIILATISINIVMKGGLIGRTQMGSDLHKKEAAREKLSLVLDSAIIEKELNKKYNQNEFLDAYILKECAEAKVIGDIVIVDEHAFEIDRSVPKISDYLGQGMVNEAITVLGKVTDTDNDTNAKLQIEVTYAGTIKEITINGKKLDVPTPVNGVYTLEETIMENGIYNIIVKDEKDGYQSTKVEITNLAENMEIWNKEDMSKLRDMVNDGKTFTGRTVQVMTDIDLDGNDNNMWIPISTHEKQFKGTFEGNYHTISNLYYKGNEYQALGLFGRIYDATIQNVVMENVQLYNNYSASLESWTGAITGLNRGKIINCGVNSGNISANHELRNTSTGWNTVDVGGIAGVVNAQEVKGCYNKADISAQCVTLNYNMVAVGGIVGYVWPSVGSVTTSNCYNQGQISGNGYETYVGGIIGMNTKTGNNSNNATISNSYNIGNVTGSGTNLVSIGGIAGSNSAGGCPQGSIVNSYCKTDTIYSYRYWNNGTLATATQGRTESETLKTYTSKLGDVFKEDETNINDGFPILGWQLKENR